MHQPHPDPGAHPHVLPVKVLLGTAGALVALTALTVVTSRLDLGAFAVAVALAIASVKAALVALYFMHLRYQDRSHAVVAVASLLFAVLLVVFVIGDTVRYQPDLREAEGAARAAGRR